MKYGHYGKSHKSQGIAALQGEEGEKLRALREASAKTRKSHLAKNTWIKNNLDVMDIKGCKTSKLRKYFSDVGDVSEFIDTPVNRFTSKYVICK